jgi:hypothetical protein
MSLRLPALHHYLHSALESLVYPGTQTPLVRVHTRLRPMPSKYCSSISHSSDASGNESGSSAQASSSALATKPTQSLQQLFKRKLSTLLSTYRTTLPTDVAPPVITGSLPHSTPSVPLEEGHGYVISCTFYDSQGHLIPLTHISRLASASGISLRTGCVCNPGGAVALRGKCVQETIVQDSNFDEQEESEETCTLMAGLANAGVVRLSLGLVTNFEDMWRLVCWTRGLLDETKREKDLKRLIRD